MSFFCFFCICVQYSRIGCAAGAILFALLITILPACSKEPPAWLARPISAEDALETHASTPSGDGPAPAGVFPIDCRSDADCGYDPIADRCGSDPHLNKQPPVVDQGIICYCENAACAMLRVLPVPCEGDQSCAVKLDPRPHPVKATRHRPHERARPCRDMPLTTTCERTNICTLRRVQCTASPARRSPR